VTRICTNLYKRKHRSGTTVWMVRWLDPKSGHWKARTGGKTKDEAALVEAKVRLALIQGKDPFPDPKDDPTGKNLVFGELLDTYIESARFRTYSAHWQVTREGRIRQKIRPYFGKKTLSELNEKFIYAFFFELQKEGLSNNTIRQYFKFLCQIGDVAVEEFKLETNPFRELKNFSKEFKKQASCRDINFLTPEELTQLYQAAAQARSKRLLLFIQFQAGTGLRRSETLHLKWTDVDWSSGFLHVRQSKNGKARIVPIEPEVARVLRQLPRISSYVFAREDGQPMDMDSFLVPLKRAAKRAGIQKRVDVHTLRHSYGSNKIRAGWGLKKVSKLLGHSDITITEQVYSHLLDGDLRVRDEFHFDNGPVSANSEEQVLSDETIKMAFSNVLSGFLNPEAKTDAATSGDQAPEELVRMIVSEVIQQSLPTSESHQNASAARVGTGTRATPMLRSLAKPQKQQSPGHGPEAELLSHLNHLIQNKMAIPTGVEPVTFSSGG